MTNKKLPTFDLMEKYHAETKAQQQRAAEYAAAVKDAEALVNELELKRDNALNAAVVDGEQNDKELQALDKELAKAEAALVTAKQKREVAIKLGSRSISLQDVEREFQAFSKQYKDEQVEAAIEELRKAKEEYAKKYIELARVLEHHDDMAREVTFTVKPKAITTLYRISGFGTELRRKYATISEYDNEQLERGVLPRSITEK
ncbi:hypothetical protein ACQCVK_02885 [Rossellomorea vietnamensis]|uniref:hypothetical protein n=1 Tax=Rossellomorea vietnamensis TaxID=218284 RepID=UPI003CF173DC